MVKQNARLRLLRWGSVAAVNEEPSHVLGTHGSQCSTHDLDESLIGAGADLPEDSLDLREGLFYRVEI
jgi:hypothetical protein